MKPISQMTREEKLQEIVEYNPCRVERSAVLRYLLAVRRNDTEQIAYFESFGKSVRHIILNVRTYGKMDDFRLCRQAVQRTRLDKWHVADNRGNQVRHLQHDPYRAIR